MGEKAVAGIWRSDEEAEAEFEGGKIHLEKNS